MLKVLLDYKVADDIKIVHSSSEVGVQVGKSGKVDGSTIYILEDDPDKALDILNHEFLEYLLSPWTEESFKVHNADTHMIQAFFESYRKLTDKMLYDSKEKSIGRLEIGISKLINSVIDRKEVV